MGRSDIIDRCEIVTLNFTVDGVISVHLCMAAEAHLMIALICC